MPDGEDAGEVEYAAGSVQAGDVILVSGNRKLRVLSLIPTELAGEFVDGPGTEYLKSNQHE